MTSKKKGQDQNAAGKQIGSLHKYINMKAPVYPEISKYWIDVPQEKKTNLKTKQIRMLDLTYWYTLATELAYQPLWQL